MTEIDLSVAQSAEMLGVSKEVVRKWCQQGAVRAQKVGSGHIQRWRIPKSEIDEIRRTGGVKGSPDLIKIQPPSPGYEGIDDDDEFEEMISQIGEGTENISVDLERLKPAESPYGGFLRSYSHPIKLADIEREWGGGTYRIVVTRGNRRKSAVKTIAGDPVDPGDIGIDDRDFTRGRGRGRSGSWDFRSRDSWESRYSARNSEMGEVIGTLRDMQTSTSDRLTQVMELQQARADEERRTREEQARQDRKEKEEDHKRQMDLLDRKHEIDMEREKARLETEKERIRSERELERERLQADKQLQQERLERDRERDKEFMKFMAGLDAKKEEVLKDGSKKTEEYLNKSIAHHQTLLDKQGDMLEREAQRDREHIAELKEAAANKESSESTVAEVVGHVVKGATSIADRVTDKIGQNNQQAGALLSGTNGPTSGQPGTPELPSPQESEKKDVSLTERMANDDMLDLLEMMADHAEKGIPPHILAGVILRQAEDNSDVEFAVAYAVGKELSELVGLFPQISSRIGNILRSDVGKNYFDNLKILMVGSYQEPVAVGNETQSQPPEEKPAMTTESQGASEANSS